MRIGEQKWLYSGNQSQSRGGRYPISACVQFNSILQSQICPLCLPAPLSFPFRLYAGLNFTVIMSSAQAHLARAIHQIQDKAPIPEIDFTQHQLEDGNTISTQERVVKDVR